VDGRSELKIRIYRRAEQINKPMESSPAEPAGATTSSVRRAPEDAADYATVSDPVIHADGMNKYTSYRVDCRPPMSEPGREVNPDDPFLQCNAGQYSSVLRRYSDFLWLYERLHRERAGAIVPPLPEKQAVSRFSPEFVEERRGALEKFLRRVILHPELNDAGCLLTFLRADDMQFAHAKSVSKKSDDAAHQAGDMSANLGGAGAFNLTAKNTKGIKKWFSEAKTTMSGELVTSPDDDLFDEIERYVEALSIQMKRVSNQATGLVRKSKEIANGMFEYGLAFHQLGQSEGEDLGKKLEAMASASDELSALAARHAEAEVRRLEVPFTDYLKTIHAVKLALNRRHDKRVSYTALLHEIQSREMSLQRLRMTPGMESKAYSTEMSLQRYQAAAEQAREEYAEVSQRVLREVDRFKREKSEEMRSVVLEFILLEVEMNRAAERIWADLVPRLEEGGVPGVGVGRPVIVGGGTDGTVVNLPPPPVPPSTANPTAPPAYSNVPAVDPMSESAIQYREPMPGMGL